MRLPPIGSPGLFHEAITRELYPLVQFILKHSKQKARETESSPTKPRDDEPPAEPVPAEPVPAEPVPAEPGADSAHTEPGAASDADAEAPAPAKDTGGGDEPERTRKPRRRGGRRRRRPRRTAEDEDAKPAPEESKPAAEAARDDWDPASYVVEPEEGETRFTDLDLPAPILHAIADLQFKYCTPIQTQTLPITLTGRDIKGQAQTGTGKTAAFLITMFSRFFHDPAPADRAPGTPRALVLAPTRELALQIEKDAHDLGKYMDLKTIAVFGGMDYRKQQRYLESPVDVVIATPGRLLDFKQNQDIHLNKVEVLVIDEADRMLDMGFIPDVRRIVFSTPPKTRRQTLFFSATLTTDVHRLAEQWTRLAESVEIEPEHVAVDTVDQRVYIVTAHEKFPLFLNLIDRENAERVMVFANRRDQTRKLTELLRRYGISCAMLSGDVPQTRRIKTLDQFRSGAIRVLVATDVAGRGIHVDDVSHVVNFTLPQDPEDYVHRIGRTGRAGASGISVSFACESDAFQIPAIEEFIGNDLPCLHPDDDWLVLPPEPELTAEQKRQLAEHRERDDRAAGRGGRSGGGRSRSRGPQGHGTGGGRHSRSSRGR